MIGRVLGTYRILERLGEGDDHTRWRAEDTRLGRIVELRTLRTDLADPTGDRERFLARVREDSVAGRSGPGAVHDAGEADGVVYAAYALESDATVSEPRPAAKWLWESPTAGLARWWRRTARRRFGPLQVAIASALVLGVSLLWQQLARHASNRAAPVLAVMPMRIAEGDSSEAAVVVQALGEELVTRFVSVGGVDMLPWVTSGAPRPDSVPPARFAREVHADLALSGTVRVESGSVRVHAELLDVRTERLVWADEIVSPLGDYLTLQSQLVLGVIARVPGASSGRARERLAATVPRNPEAYELFIRGSNAFRSNDPDEAVLAEPMLARAVELDSTLAGAWVALGAVHTDRYFRNVGGSADLVDAERMFRRALALSPGLPVAERGLIRLWYESDEDRYGKPDVGLEIASAALARDPNDVDQLLTAGWGYTLGGLASLAVPVFDRILRLDPHNQPAAWFRIVALNWAGDNTRCVEAAKAYTREFGEDPEVYTWMGQSLDMLGQHSAGVMVLERAVQLFGSGALHYSRLILARVHQASGDSVRGRRVILEKLADARRQLAATPDNSRLAGGVFEVYVLLDDSARAVQAFAVLAPQQMALLQDREAPMERASYHGHGGRLAALFARHGDVQMVERILSGIAPGDDREWDNLDEVTKGRDPGSRRVAGSATFLRLRDSVRAGVRARYLRHRAVVARALAGEPDIPGVEDVPWPKK